MYNRTMYSFMHVRHKNEAELSELRKQNVTYNGNFMVAKFNVTLLLLELGVD